MSKQAKATEDTKLADMLTQLDELMAWFDRDNVDLEEALEKFEEASKLAEAIQARLGDVENKITVLKKRFDVEA